MTSDTDSDFDLHGLVQRRPLDALDLIAEKVEELSKLVTALVERRDRRLIHDRLHVQADCGARLCPLHALARHPELARPDQ